jgi:hypothetical protein
VRPVEIPEPKNDLLGVLVGFADTMMMVVGFVPGLDIISDLYFTARAALDGDWQTTGICLGCALVPGASAALYKVFRSGARGAKWIERAEGVSAVRKTVRATEDSIIPGTETSRVLTEDITVYRAYGGKSPMRARWFALTEPPNRQVARDLYSLPPGNTAERCVSVWVPRGTVIKTSIASPLFCHPGYGVQIFIENPDALLYGLPRWLG